MQAVMRGSMERLLDCPVAGRKVRVLEVQEVSRPTMSCCLSSRILLSRCDEEEECRQRDTGVSCPLWSEHVASCSEGVDQIEWTRF